MLSKLTLNFPAGRGIGVPGAPYFTKKMVESPTKVGVTFFVGKRRYQEFPPQE